MDSDGTPELRSSPSPHKGAHRSSLWDAHNLGVRSLDLGTLARGECPIPVDSNPAEGEMNPGRNDGNGYLHAYASKIEII